MTGGDEAEPTKTPTLWPVAWLALASAAAVGIANWTGLAIGDDGVGYRAISDSLTRGDGFGYFLERPVTIWPPGWPSLMSLVDRITPFDAEGAAAALNSLTAAAIVVLTHRLLRRLSVDPLVINLVTTVAAIGASAMVFGHLLMTDFAFMALILGWFLALLNARESDGLRWILGAAALVWAAFMIRYAGVVLIGTGALWVLADSRRTVRTRAIRAGVFVAAAALVPALWILRNRSVDGTALGVRYSSARGLIGNGLDLVATIGNFLVPGVEVETRTLWAAVGVVGAGLVGLLLWRVLRDRQMDSPRTWPALLGSPIGLLVVHVCLYAAYMLYARTTTGLNRLDFRLLNPMYLPLVIIAACVIDRIRREPATDRRWARGATAALVSWAGVNVAVGVVMVGYFATGPDLFVGNYEREAFADVRSNPALKQVPDACSGPTRLSSNLPNALYPALGANWSARKTGLESNDPVDDLAELQRAVEAGEPRCVVWIDLEPTYGHLATVGELSKVVSLVPLAQSGPVTVYELEPSAGG